MSYFSIPTDRYKKPLIAACLIRKRAEVWDIKNVRKQLRGGKLRDPEDEDKYFRFEREYVSLEEFCSSAPFNFTIKTENGILKFPKFDSPEIYFDLVKSRVIFDEADLYWIPGGVEKKYYVNQLLEKTPRAQWNPENFEGEKISFDMVERIERSFKVSIKIWSREFCNKTHANFYEEFYCGSHFYEDTIYLHYQKATEMFLIIDNPKKYFEKYFRCKNPKCFFILQSEKLLKHHENLCGATGTKIVQDVLGPTSELLERAEKHGLIPRLIEPNRNFAFFDIESVLPSSNIRTQKTTVHSTHQVVSIAVNR